MKTRSVRRTAVAAIVVTLAMIASISPAGAFSDVKTNHPFYDEITWASNNGIVNGYPDGTFRGGGQVTRQAISAFMYRMAAAPGYTPTGPHFPDVPVDHAFYDEIEWMVDAELTTGYSDGLFHPSAPVTRQAVAAFIWRLLGSPTPSNPEQVFLDVPMNHPFFVPILFVWDFYIADGYPAGYGFYIFKPSGIVTRQAATAFLYRTYQAFGPSGASPGDASGAAGASGTEDERGPDGWSGFDVPAELAG